MINSTPIVAFPDHSVDPKVKVKSPFMLQMCKATYSNWQTSMPTDSIFLAKAARYDEIRNYAMARQSVDKHKKELLPEDPNDESFTKISWEVRSDGMVIRNIAVAKTQKGEYNIIATPINPTAKDAQDEEFKKAQIKILMRQAMQKTMPEQANHPLLKQRHGEAKDLDQLKYDIAFSPKLVRAKDVEESIELVFSENDADAIFDVCAEDIVDFGVGIVREVLNENNKVVMEQVYPGRFACSYTERKDFGDITWAFQIRPTKLSDLAKKLDADAIKTIYNKVRSTNGNPAEFGNNTLDNNGYDIFKADVMDLEFISWNPRVIEATKDKNGNPRVSKAKPSKADKSNDKNTYISKSIEVVYQCKWVIGTDYIFDFGPAANIKRDVNIATMGKTKLSYHIKAASFSKMRATGLTEALIPIIDDLNSITFKLRMFRNRMVPNGFDIDLGAIEDVALGKSGEVMTPKEVIDMFFETGILVSRRSGVSMDENQNYKAINAISNGMADQIVALANELQNAKQALSEISGLNAMTDGSTPNPKTLVPVANLANESTNNALYFIINAKTSLIESVARGVVKRLQVALKRGPYDGFNPTKGYWISVPASIQDYDYDIMIESKTSDDQKQWLYNLVKEDIANGLLNAPDVIAIINDYNMKDAQMQLAYLVTKNKRDQQQQEIAVQQATGQAGAASAQAAESAKLTADEQRHKWKMEEIELMQAWNFLINAEKMKQQESQAQTKAVTDIMTTVLSGNGDPSQQNGNQALPQTGSSQMPGLQPGSLGLPDPTQPMANNSDQQQ